MNERDMLAKALDALQARGTNVDKRLRYYAGEHDSALGSKAWNDSYRAVVAGIRDNQCALVVDAHAETLVPSGVRADTGDTWTDVLAAWVNDRLTDEAPTLAEFATIAEASGTQAVVAVDYNSAGDVDFYPLDPRSTYVEVDRGGMLLWAVHFWRDYDKFTNATVYLPTETVAYRSLTKRDQPLADDFSETTRTPNPFGELMLAVVDKRGSVLDRVMPLNDVLNKSMQTAAVVGEAYALPFRVYLGIETYNPETGEVNEVLPNMNPATGGRDVSLPTTEDAEGGERKVIQFASPEPEKYLAEQDSLRVAIARNASIPAFMLQLGGNQPASGEALQIAYRPFLAKVGANRRIYRAFYNRLTRLAARRYLYATTGVPAAAPNFSTEFPEIDLSIVPDRTEAFRAAVDAGMTLADALVSFLGWDREAAELAQANSREESAAAAAAGATWE